MNPLYIDSAAVSVSIKGHSLLIMDRKDDKVIEEFRPREIPYDSIVIQRGQGWISLAAINWLVLHNVSVTILNWRGNVLAQILPDEPISNELKIAQYQAYLDPGKRLQIARAIIETKEGRQQEFLTGLAQNYPVRAPTVPPLARSRLGDMDYLRNHEARYAVEYFKQLQKVSNGLGFEFRGRTTTEHNQKAPDFVNALMNYSYALLQTYVRRATNAIGLDNSIPFVHEMGQSRGLVYDLMELWRTNSDYAVVQTLEQLNAKDRNHYLTDTYEAMLSEKTIRLLFMNFKLGLKLEEIILNTRRFASFLLGRSQSLEFALKPVAVKETFEKDAVKEMILTRSHRELGMNKSTLWYQRKRLRETGSVRLYNRTKQHFGSEC
ncbi:MAG: CRISPR-associated endonuclease Cas1 [Nitrososphaerota archaeon]|jgi:CRISPR-associated protein Cas1|nr:CRISPR-associated endonuclease Cas1 [Ferrimicrobium acidiphilum]MDG6912918.1 CRISPR-associated endonuclease Cas1 [Nitrososphaerota archaeon]